MWRKQGVKSLIVRRSGPPAIQGHLRHRSSSMSARKLDASRQVAKWSSPEQYSSLCYDLPLMQSYFHVIIYSAKLPLIAHALHLCLYKHIPRRTSNSCFPLFNTVASHGPFQSCHRSANSGRPLHQMLPLRTIILMFLGTRLTNGRAYRNQRLKLSQTAHHPRKR